LVVQLFQTVPTADAANAGALTGAGVYILGSDSACSIARHHTLDAKGKIRSTTFQLMGRKTNSSTSGGRGANNDEATKPVYFRLVREGNSISSKFGTDGKTWKPLWTYEGEFPPEVTVGVFAENTGVKGYEAVFEGLKLDTGDKK
jgi:hypothetical protein